MQSTQERNLIAKSVALTSSKSICRGIFKMTLCQEFDGSGRRYKWNHQTCSSIIRSINKNFHRDLKGKNYNDPVFFM